MFNKEPALVAKVIEEIVRAAVPLALIFGWVNWSDAQEGVVLMFIGVVAGGLTLLFTRQSSVAKVVADKQMEIAKASSVDRPTDQIVKEARESV